MSVSTITVGEATCSDMLVPIQDALYVVNGKWKILILVAISHGYQRFTDIQKNVPKISGNMLAKELKELEQYELIKRTDIDD